jgi:AcrR family transcriptional regulator
MEELPCRGRPRCPEVHRKILTSVFDLLGEVGYAGLTMESVAARAEVGKASLYRRWSGKAPLVMEALLDHTAVTLAVPETGSAVNDILVQMRGVAELLSGRSGRMLGCLIACSHEDPELAREFHEFLRKRREAAKAILVRGQERGELRRDLDCDVTLDALYGPLHYRLLVSGAPLDAAFVTTLWEHVMNGLIRRKEV